MPATPGTEAAASSLHAPDDLMAQHQPVQAQEVATGPAASAAARADAAAGHGGPPSGATAPAAAAPATTGRPIEPVEGAAATDTAVHKVDAAAADAADANGGSDDHSSNGGRGGAGVEQPTAVPADDPHPWSTPGVARVDPPSSSSSGGGGGGGGGGFVPVLLASAVVAGSAWLIRRMLRKPVGHQHGHGRGGSGGAARGTAVANGAAADASAEAEEQAPAPPDALTLLLPVDAIVAPAEPPPDAEEQASPAVRMHVVVSEDVDIAGVASTVGVDAWRAHTPAADSTATALRLLVGAGATCLGKTALQPLGLDLLGRNVGCPTNRHRAAGGGATGAAATIATGLAHVALANDAAGEGRCPAACCGISALRPSPGLVPPLSGAAVEAPPPLLNSACILARSEAMLSDVAGALQLPGSSDLRGEIIKFVVAQDLFDLCAPELQPATVAIKKAILRWAGADQAGAVQLIKFLSANTSAWRAMPVKPPASADDDASEIRLGAFVEACIMATQVLRVEDLHRKLEGLEPHLPPVDAPVPMEQHAAAPAVERDTGAGASLSGPASGGERGDGDVNGDGSGGSSDGAGGAADSPAGRVGALAAVLPERPSRAIVDAAVLFQSEVSDVLRQTVKPDTIMVLPAMPFPPPKRDADAVECNVFVRLVQAFSAFASLGGTPSVTCPIGNLRDGSPVAISLFGVHKFDLRLLAVARRLVPMVRESFVQVKEDITQRAIAEAEQAAADGGHGGAAAGKGNVDADAPAQMDPKRVERAERFKAKGNEAYMAGRHADAVAEYTKAINTNPGVAVYYNNRAMSCIRLFRFEQAEQDCCRALAFADLSTKDKVKALLRRATARDALQKYDEAEKDLKQVLSLESNNRQAREDLQTLRTHKAEMVAAQRAMIASMRQQQAAGNNGRVASDSAEEVAAAALAAGIDPSTLPPGLDPRELAALHGGYEHQ